MRPLSKKTKRILTDAGLWSQACVICGARPVEAEHAVYETATGAQGIGARQCGEAWSIIPCCRDCNARPADKSYHRYIAFVVAEERDELQGRFSEEYSRLAQRYDQFVHDRRDGCELPPFGGAAWRWVVTMKLQKEREGSPAWVSGRGKKWRGGLTSAGEV